MNRRALFALLAASAVMAPALVTPALAQIDFNVTIGTPPPPARYEVVPAPRTGYVWAPGHWQWDGRQHAWRAGHWEQARAGYRYVPDRWERYTENGREQWRYQASRWDRDGDGIPNRYDNRDNRQGAFGDRDRDGIPNAFDTRNDRARARDTDRDGVPDTWDRDRYDRRRW